tara:strand:- start:5350 stop:5478 length:129 start_codon:yes stop_codon:yes gene_type:complete
MRALALSDKKEMLCLVTVEITMVAVAAAEAAARTASNVLANH